ncbi:MAG: efflux RND transporter periplasmic adaptor subunit [Deltaproteobacteria bacterium]|nr:efflux RND transporter periplasmic adaptor subunit [Deltaproteobacteria bacterium]
MRSILLFTLLALVTCSKNSDSTAATSGGSNGSFAATVKAKKGRIEQIVNLRGTVRSSNRIEMRAERKVKISKNRVKNFDPVKKGQILSEVDNSETETKVRELKDKSKTMELEFQSVKIKYSHAQKVLERKKALFDKGIIAQKEFDDANRDYRLSGSEIRAKELEMEKLGRDLAEANDQMKSSNFVSPMDGVVTGLVIPEGTGTEVQAGQSVATISDPDRLALWVGVEEGHLHKVKAEMSAEISLDSVPNETIKGKIISIGTTEIGGQAARVRTYEVGISFVQKGMAIREGYTGQAKSLFELKENVLTVGIRTDSEVEIVSGISENDTVYVASSENQ